MGAPTVWEKLSERFSPDEISWRPQSIIGPDGKSQKGVRAGSYPEGSKAKFLAYIDARNVMDRLDTVLGPEGWSDRYRELEHDGKGHVLSVECALTIGGVTKVDVGYRNAPDNDTEAEPAKAAYSDAFKRAAVKFGVGRFLYDMGDSGWVPVDKWGKALKAMPGSSDHKAQAAAKKEVQRAVTAANAAASAKAQLGAVINKARDNGYVDHLKAFFLANIGKEVPTVGDWRNATDEIRTAAERVAENGEA